MDFEEQLAELLQKNSTGSFLFIGSGTSRRYIGLEDWNDLLKVFANKINKNFTRFKTKANSKSEIIATLLAKDYNEVVWDLPQFKPFIEKYERSFSTSESELKYAISDYLAKKTEITIQRPEELQEEIDLLKNLEIDGIITTNWDTFLEKIYPNYKVYIGQEDLIFNPTYAIGEIYKIHGSITEPESLVLTAENYKSFEKKNAYLAAKLITIFVEHPVIFLGYSLSDPNIINILSSITECLDSDEKLQRFQENLIFVDYKDDINTIPSIGQEHIVVKRDSSTIPLPITHISTHSFLPIFKAINKVKRQIPSHLIRTFKKQIYKITETTKPTKELQCLIDISRLDDTQLEQIKKIVGFALLHPNSSLSTKSYNMYDINDLAKDILGIATIINNATECLTVTIPLLQGFVPKYKYLAKEGITSQELFDDSPYSKLEIYTKKEKDKKNPEKKEIRKNLIPSAVKIMYNRHYQNWTIKDIIEREPNIDKQIQLIPCCKCTNEDIPLIKDILIKNLDNYLPNKNSYTSAYRKLLCFYDYLLYGWK